MTHDDSDSGRTSLSSRGKNRFDVNLFLSYFVDRTLRTILKTLEHCLFKSLAGETRYHRTSLSELKQHSEMTTVTKIVLYDLFGVLTVT